MSNYKHRHKKKYFKLLLFVLILVVIFFLPSFFIKNRSLPLIKKEAKEAVIYYVPVSHFTDKADNLTLAELKAKYQASGNEVYVGEKQQDRIKLLLDLNQLRATVVKDEEIVKLLTEKSDRFALIPYDQVRPNIKSLSVNDHFLWDKPANYPLKLSIKTEQGTNTFEPERITLLTNVGDVILGRHVAKKMAEYGDYNHPWLKMAAYLARGDLTFADLECPLSDSTSPPDEGMSFIAPQKSISGFKLAGIDIVGLANNHSTNFGGISDTIDLLNKENIKYVGAGKNSTEAYSPVYIEKNGLKFAFLDFNSIIGAINATEESAGVAKFDIKPWSKIDNQNDIDRIKALVKEADSKSDMVVVQFHWGVEYESEPIQSQINVARAAIDAGADLIVGTHPHTVQGMEYYQNVPVLYSLGNFIFDQEWSIETKQGTLAQTYFYDKKLVAIKLVPYQIEDYNQPDFATTSQKKQILDRIFNASISKDYRY